MTGSEACRLLPTLLGAKQVLVLSFGLLCSCTGAEVVESLPLLRVATPGNAPPYSQRIDTSLVGIDIDLARDLGAWMGRRVEFVGMSWPTLLRSLAENRFDIAMGGIYVTHERELAGLFSDPYLYVSQQAVVRCSEVGRFQTLADVNRADVNVFATLGGANPQFMGRDLPNATFVPIDPDPREAVRLVAQGEGDIVFGNSLAVQYLTRRDPRICIGFGGVAVNDDLAIGILMAQGSPLLAEVNRWVRLRVDDGLVERVVQAHLDAD